MLNVVPRDGAIHFGDRFSVSFQRTLRIPDDGRDYPLPPGLGRFPIFAARENSPQLPAEWNEPNTFLIPMYQREALWLGFHGARWKPNAVQVGVGQVNALTGEPWTNRLDDEPQSYLVCPDQPWLDGIKVGHGSIRQFVAVPLGQGYSVEAQVTGNECWGGIQLRVFEPKPGRFPEHGSEELPKLAAGAPMAARSPMGLGAGGKMHQKVYPDRYGLDAWDSGKFGEARVQIVNSADWKRLTGMPVPASPIDAGTYTRYGLPWFALYDDDQLSLSATENLRGLKSISQLKAEREDQEAQQEDSLDVRADQVQTLRPPFSSG